MKFCKKRCILFIILTYDSRVIGENVRKISKYGNLKTQIYEQMIYHIVGHKILSKTLYFFRRCYFRVWRYLRKCMKKIEYHRIN